MEKQNIIPFFGVKRQYQNLKEELLAASDTVYTSGQVLDGPHTSEFESLIAERCNRKYAVAVNSGSQGLIFAQQATFPKNSKILIPAISFVATLNSVLATGNEAVMCDTDDQALIDLESLDYAIKSAGVSGVMYVNMFGNVVNWDRFKLTTEFFNQNLPVIEDAAQSFGAFYKNTPSGCLGDISVLSFDPTKNLNNYGSGGMVLTDDKDTRDFILNCRDNGKLSSHDYIGTNSKMSEADCAQMIVKLKYFDSWQQRRQEIAEYYSDELRDHVAVPKVSDDVIHSWHKYVIKVRDRHLVMSKLALDGIESKIHYDKPLYEHPVGYPYINYAAELYREASAFCKECMSLPIYPELTDNEVERIVQQVKSLNKR